MTRSISSTDAPDTRRIKPLRLSATGSEGWSASGRWRRKNATSRRTNSRISPSKAAAASWSTSLTISGDFRFGAYSSGPGFSGTAPSRSGLMAVMVNSYQSARIFARGPQLRADCRTRLGQPWGEPAGTQPAANSRRQVMHDYLGTCACQCSLNPAVTLLLLVVCPKSVSAVVTWSGPYSFCSALSVLWVTGSLLADASPAPRVVPVGRILNFTVFSLPKT